MVLVAAVVVAQKRPDPKSISFAGIPLEGPADSLKTALTKVGYTEWGASQDSTQLFFRGGYYGFRVKLMIGIDTQTGLVENAMVTCGPYRTKGMLNNNVQYFLNKLTKEYGDFDERNGAHYFLDDYGMVKLSLSPNDDGTQDIKIFFYVTSPYYKDASMMALKGRVQEVVTENPVAENPMEQFAKSGMLLQPDIIDRQYDAYGYLTRATMREEQGGQSLIEYKYDQRGRLVRRTLTNTTAAIRYVNEYTYNNDNEITEQSQRVFDKMDECIMSLNLKNHYEEHDDEGNWTSNTLDIIYWEKGQRPQPGTVKQTRTIKYWE